MYIFPNAQFVMNITNYWIEVKLSLSFFLNILSFHFNAKIISDIVYVLVCFSRKIKYIFLIFFFICTRTSYTLRFTKFVIKDCIDIEIIQATVSAYIQKMCFTDKFPLFACTVLKIRFIFLFGVEYEFFSILL